jgi:hypothetical protein
MAFFFRKKIKASEFATVLGQIALDPNQAEEFLSATVDAVEISSKDQESQVLSAIVMLRICASAYAIVAILGTDTPESKAVLKHFFSILKRIDVKTTTGTTFFDAFRDVSSIYTTALKTPHELGPFFNVGKEFAKQCGKEYDARFMYFGSTLFSHTVDMIREIIKNTPIKI